MQAIGGKKALPLCILKILSKYTDHDHPISMRDLIARLSREYSIEAERKSVARNLSLLMEMGYDISTYDENGKGYYLRERDFTDAELRLLIDSVLSSRFIPKRDAERLVDKIKDLSTEYFARETPHVVSMNQFQHPRNKEFFYILEILSQAITGKKQVSFIYNEYGMDGLLHPRRERPYIVNPYEIVVNSGHYYLIANYSKYDNITHYRLDRITGIELLNTARRPISDLPEHDGVGFDIGQYVSEHIYMFCGKPEPVRLRMPITMTGNVVSAFGPEVSMTPAGKDLMDVRLNIAPEGVRLWVLQQGCECEVLEPQSLRKWIRREIKAMRKIYANE
ncbi:MAG: helix-turn-helix transcriptional regulator [Christensenellales bacterium]|jgi:predicted DNA-binding transcriptional regulator YafY